MVNEGRLDDGDDSDACLDVETGFGEPSEIVPEPPKGPPPSRPASVETISKVGDLASPEPGRPIKGALSAQTARVYQERYYWLQQVYNRFRGRPDDRVPDDWLDFAAFVVAHRLHLDSPASYSNYRSAALHFLSGREGADEATRLLQSTIATPNSELPRKGAEDAEQGNIARQRRSISQKRFTNLLEALKAARRSTLAGQAASFASATIMTGVHPHEWYGASFEYSRNIVYLCLNEKDVGGSEPRGFPRRIAISVLYPDHPNPIIESTLYANGCKNIQDYMKRMRSLSKIISRYASRTIPDARESKVSLHSVRNQWLINAWKCLDPLDFAAVSGLHPAQLRFRKIGKKSNAWAEPPTFPQPHPRTLWVMTRINEFYEMLRYRDRLRARSN